VIILPIAHGLVDEFSLSIVDQAIDTQMGLHRVHTRTTGTHEDMSLTRQQTTATYVSMHGQNPTNSQAFCSRCC